jgi:hypothetical protein
VVDKKKLTSVKHLQISKSQSTVLGIIVATVVIVIFSLFATKALILKGSYQRRALHARRNVVDQLKKNYDSANQLFSQYKVFADQDPNILGGTVNGQTNLDGANPRIVLDALPSQYDAPALATSIEKIMTGRGLSIAALSLNDDPVSNSDQPQSQPTAKPMTFSFAGTTDYANAAQLFKDFEHSIRPFDLNTLEINGTDAKLNLTAAMTTYFQPAKSLNLDATKEVK